MLRKFAIPFVFLLTITAGSGDDKPAPSPATTTGSTTTLLASDGQMHTPLANRGQKATVLIFLMHDCPVTNATAPELIRLASEFTSRGVDFFGIYSTETATEINRHRHDYGLPFHGLLDPSLQLARIVGATCAPEAAVISPKGELLYRGRVDDRATKAGSTRPIPGSHDLQRALEAVLAGQRPEPRFTTSIGCYLPMK